MRLTTTILLLILTQTLFGQKSLKQLLSNKDFKWVVDSSSSRITIYYQTDSWVSSRMEIVKQKMLKQIDSVQSFMQINPYNPRINLFIVDTRKQMKDLIGWETNGTAFYKHNILTGVASEKSNAIFANHELFHLIAMNIWGVPETWLNEGMAIYADNNWYGYDLYQLTNYLMINNRYVPLEKLIKEFRNVDSMLSYPLMGSFTRYLNETYGREMVIHIWKGKSKQLEKLTGKSLAELEKDWLAKIKTSNYQNIKY